MMINNIVSSTYSAPNFRAKFIKRVPINELDIYTQKYKPSTAAFVEFEVDNEHDLRAMSKAQSEWSGELFARDIVDAAGRLSMGELKRPKNRIFLLTTQKGGYKQLDKDSIIGMAQMVGGKSATLAELKFFQVRPDLNYKKEGRYYTGAGKAILDAIKEIYTKAIKLQSCYTAANFYEKQGFEIINKSSLTYLWQSKKSKALGLKKLMKVLHSVAY